MENETASESSAAHDHDRGLAYDLRLMAVKFMKRRRFLHLAAGVGFASLTASLACGDDDDDDDDATGAATDDDVSADDDTAGDDDSDGSCSTIPEETEGPYPGDGSNGPNALEESGVVRSDIRSGFGDASGTAAGVLTTLTLTLVDTNNDCAPLSGYAVYLWHCDSEGRYSLYDLPSQNYLRGVQVSDDNGRLTFTTIFPGCYAGRWPHMHFEIYPSLAVATSAANKIATSQLALPESACNEVYAESDYDSSAANLAVTSLASDTVFNDGVESQMASVSGTVAGGLTATLTVGVSA
ncbi:MAG: hypothetical protein H6684_10570 [Deltaproteobacteria bacterium]|nr:hypothetical protein [Deltaproteobacteria bacterium]